MGSLADDQVDGDYYRISEEESDDECRVDDITPPSQVTFRGTQLRGLAKNEE